MTGFMSVWRSTISGPPYAKIRKVPPMLNQLILIIMATQDKFYYSLVGLAAIITIMVIIMMFTGFSLALAKAIGIGTLVALGAAITYCIMYGKK